MKPRAQSIFRRRGVLLALTCTMAAFAGCSEVVPTSGPHPALTMDQVKIYQKPPAKYEMLGTIEVPVTPEMKWDERGDSTKGFEALLTKAGAKGANGILLEADDKLHDTMVGVGYKGTYYLVPLRREPRTAVVSTIFVVEDK